MIKFYTYVLYSQTFNKIYIGQTSDLNRRLSDHNSGKSTHTSRYIPWEIFYSEGFSSRSEAMKREKQLKSQKEREFIWNLLNDRVL